MHKNRLEAFSDGVIAIIITIMVLELKAPHGEDLKDLLPVIPTFLSYVLSFLYVAIYWNNHHHLFQLVKRVSGPVLWANIHLLFWLSLIPAVTAWSDESDFAAVPVALYGVVLLLAAIAYYILGRALLACHERDSGLANALGTDVKGIVSPLLYAVAIPLAFWWPAASLVLYALVAAIWFIPDRRVERAYKG